MSELSHPQNQTDSDENSPMIEGDFKYQQGAGDLHYCR